MKAHVTKALCDKRNEQEANRILHDEYLETAADFYLEFLGFVCVGSSRRNGAGQEVSESTEAFPSYTRAQLIYNAERLCGLSDTLI